MKIYTSYFANIRNLTSSIIPISIANFPPIWFRGKSIKSLAPDYKSKNYDVADFTVCYLDKLSEIGAEEIVNMIANIGRNKDVALCCFEKPTDFCHRHILSEFLNLELKLNIREYVKERVKVNQTSSLF